MDRWVLYPEEEMVPLQKGGLEEVRKWCSKGDISGIERSWKILRLIIGPLSALDVRFGTLIRRRLQFWPGHSTAPQGSGFAVDLF